MIRLADRLEDLLDRGVLYTPDADDRRRGLQRDGAQMQELACRLGYPALAARIEAAIQDSLGPEVPSILRNPSARTRGFRVLPRCLR